MNLYISRFGYGRDSTLGRFSVEAEAVGFSLEDERREVKVRGETCIPVGSYEIKRKTYPRGMKDLKAVVDKAHAAGLIHRDVKSSNILLHGQGSRERGSKGVRDQGIEGSRNWGSALPFLIPRSLDPLIPSSSSPTSAWPGCGRRSRR